MRAAVQQMSIYKIRILCDHYAVTLVGYENKGLVCCYIALR